MIRAYPLAAFTVLACLFGWSLFIASRLGASVQPTGMPLGPILAALIVSALLGWEELKQWGRRLVTLRAPLSWYALAAVAPIVLVALPVLVNSVFGAPLPTASQLAGWPDLIATFVFILIAIGIGEEAGWMAFAAPRLLARHPFMTAWIILAAIRIFWHVPLMLSGELPLVLGIGGNAAFQFLLLWIVKRGGVWFLAAIWHAVLNTFSGSFFFQMVQGQDQARLGLLMTLAYVLAAAYVFATSRKVAQ
jgi:membrane protease YdiL (CAAX protease family)